MDSDKPDTLPPANLSPQDPPPVLLRIPGDSRSLSMAMLALFAAIFMLHWAKAVVIPVMLALTFSYALAPLVSQLERLHLPRAAAAALLLLGLVGGASSIAYSLSDDASQFAESLPTSAQKLRQTLRAQRDRKETAIDKRRRAAS